MGKREVPMSFRWSRELVERVDAARGDVSRARFVERALEAALGSAGVPGRVETSADPGRDSASPRASVAPASGDRPKVSAFVTPAIEKRVR